MKKIIFLFAPLCAMLMVGCVKDEPNQTFMRIVTEGYNPDQSAKAAVVDSMTYWINDEVLLVNGSPYKINVSASGEAVIKHLTLNDEHIYRAIYPASVVDNLSGDNCRVIVPKSHYYKESDGKQVIENLPMAAYYNGSSSGTDPEVLHFKHLTAAITVQVRNTRENANDVLELDCIELINTQYSLSGKVTFDIKDAATGAMSVANQFKGSNDTVFMYFYHDENKKLIAPGQTADIQIPILPVGGGDDGEDSKFIIQVRGHIRGARYTFEKSTNTRDNTILRAQLGYAMTKFEEQSEASDLFDITTTQTINVGNVTVEKNFYEISTPAELLTLAEALDSGWSNTSPQPVLYRFGSYIVTEDLDMHGAEIVPLHYYNENGSAPVVFNGNGKTVSNFVASSVNELEPNCCGLFGRTAGDSVIITNLSIQNAEYVFAHVNKDLPQYQALIPGDKNSCSSVGGLISCIDHKGVVIENCHVSNIRIGSVGDALDNNQTDLYASGIVGLVRQACVIRNCSVGTVLIDNSHDARPGGNQVLVDQFGAAIGRIDINDTLKYSVKGLDCPRVKIENFRYDQGSTQMVFAAGLRNIRYGGVVANITRGCILTFDNCYAKHNLKVYKPSTEMYVGGLIGCNRDNSKGAGNSNNGRGMGIRMNSNCEITGTIDNQAVEKYGEIPSGSKAYFKIGKYVGSGTGNIEKISVLSGTCSRDCTHSLIVTGLTNSFQSSSEVFDKVRVDPEVES